MPWNKKCEKNLDIKAAKEKLDEEHYGLEKVKDRILEFLAVRILTSKGQTPILCLVALQGTGKTSIARSLAEALEDLMSVFLLVVCVMRLRSGDIARTYVGAMPGRIATALRNAEVKNRLMLLDEIDKLIMTIKEIHFLHFWKYWTVNRMTSSVIIIWKFQSICRKYCLLRQLIHYKQFQDHFLTVWK